MINDNMRPDTDERIIDGVLEEFLLLCDMPHGSGNEKKASDYLYGRLKKMGAEPVQDEALNVIADLPASKGMEHAPLTIIQGHMDMVCAVFEDSGYNPLTDGIIAIVKDGKLCSNGASSLGADNGIGNAAALYIVSHPSLVHGPLRLIFTTGEEVGLDGAQRLDPNYLSGARYLINTDGFKQGDIVVSSSGGRRETYLRKAETTPPKFSRAFKLKIAGFLGGHSGYDINRGRANTIKLMAVFLDELQNSMDYELASFDGGTSHNAIPYSCEVTILIDETNVDSLKSLCFHLSRKLIAMYGITDPTGYAKLIPCETPKAVWTKACRDAAVGLCILIYNGVYSMNDFIKDRVSSSSNLGKIFVNSSGEIEIRAMVRCAVDANEEIIAAQHSKAAQFTGFEETAKGYKGWPGMKDNPLAMLMDSVYWDLTGKHLNVTAIHAGLEPSIFFEKNPELIMVNIGTDVENPHSLEEHVMISAIPPYVRTLFSTLETIAEICRE